MTRLVWPLLVCALVGAQPPSPAPPHALKLPAINEISLPNGLTVVLVEDARLPLVTLRLAFPCGNRRDPENQPGLAAAVADVMTKATHARSSLQLGEAIAGIGASIDASSGADYVAVNGSAVSGHFAEMLDIVADIARNAELSDIDLARYKQNRRQSLARQDTQPAIAANEAFRKELFGAHPYAHVGPTKESLADLTRKALIEYRDRWLVPNNAFLIVVGKFPANAEAGKLIADRFGSWEQKPLPVLTEAPLPKPARKLILIDRPGALQADVRIGRLGPAQRDPDYFAALLAATAAATADLRFDPLTFDEAGILSFTAHVDNDALPGIFDRALRLTPDTKAAVAGAFLPHLETQAGLADELMVGRIQGLPANWLETWRPSLEAVTPEAVQAAARKYLLPAEAVVVVAGDAGKLREPLAKKVGRFEVLK